ncbi:MAG: peptidylprolyl isomerase [Rhizobiaceae bacterium]
MAEANSNDSALVQALVDTELGSVTVAVDTVRAPITAANFLAYVDGGHLDGSSVYRIVSLANQPPGTKHRIEVIQWGWPMGEVSPLPRIPHEPTSLTGLRHRHGTLSMARREIGTAGPGFVFCMRNEPELDEGGGRQPDGHGFTAFGHVVTGFDTLQRIFGHAEAEDVLKNRIPIRMARRL